jgi:hypothetical protein
MPPSTYKRRCVFEQAVLEFFFLKNKNHYIEIKKKSRHIYKRRSILSSEEGKVGDAVNMEKNFGIVEIRELRQHTDRFVVQCSEWHGMG